MYNAVISLIMLFTPPTVSTSSPLLTTGVCGVTFPIPADGQAVDIDSLLTEFTTARNDLLRRPETTKADWLRFLSGWAARIPWAMLDADGLARAIFAGLADEPTGQAAAEQRLAAIPSDTPDGTAARLAAARVHLHRTADPIRQAADLHIFLAHPGMPQLARSPQAAEAIQALLSVGSGATLRSEADGVRALLLQLDAAPPTTLARYGTRIVLLLPLTFADHPSQDTARQRWLGTLQKARRNLPPEATGALQEELDASIRRLESDLRPTAPRPGETLLPSDPAPLFWSLLRLGASNGATLRLTSRSLETRADAVFEMPERNAGRRTTTLRTVDAVLSSPTDGTPSSVGATVRAFGGIALRDSALSISVQDLGISTYSPAVGFVNGFTLRATGYRFSMDRLQFFPNDTGIKGATIAANVDRYRWAEIRARSILWEPDEPGSRRMEARTLTLHTFGMRLLTIPKLGFRVGAPAAESPLSESEEPEESRNVPDSTKPVKAKNDLFRLPSVGISAGGITFGYSNGFKFPPRLTTDIQIRTYTDRRPYTSLGMNYNLRAITPSPDRLLDIIDLQENSLGSFYYRLTTQNVMRDNKELFQRELIAGIERIDNQLFTQPDDTIESLDMPFGVSLEGTTFVPRLIGIQAQATWGSVSNRNFGTSDRLTTSVIAGPPTFRLARGLRFTLRGEGTNQRYQHGTGHYWWYRSIAGLSALVVPGARLSLAGIRSREAGTPLLPSDQVPADDQLVIRSDITFGTVYLGLMDRYSERKSGFDRFQGIISVRVGVLEPYLQYDRRFQSVGFGLFVKVEEYFSRFGRRRVEQLTAERQFGSAP